MRAVLVGLGVLVFGAEAGAQVCTADPNNTVVRFETSLGDIDVELCEADAGLDPTITNFLGYVSRGDYTTSGIVHRSVQNPPETFAVIQGGGFFFDGGGVLQSVPTQTPVDLFAALPNLRGTISMARTTAPNTATSQWFLNAQDNPALDPSSFPSTTDGFAVFGQVVSGLSVVDAINALQIWALNPGVLSEVPLDNFPNDGSSALPHFVYINDVYVVPEPGAALQGAIGLGAVAVLAARRRRGAR